MAPPHPEPWTVGQQREYQAQFDERVQQWLDAGYGRCALAQPDVRDAVRACLTRFAGERVNLHAAVIMPNHVHALMEPIGGGGDTDIPAGAPQTQTGMSVRPSHPHTPLIKCIKGASARAANDVLRKNGQIWMYES